VSSSPELEPKRGEPSPSADSHTSDGPERRARRVAATIAVVLLELAWVAVLAVVAWRLLSSLT
jgi:hypothetical protein